MEAGLIFFQNKAAKKINNNEVIDIMTFFVKSIDVHGEGGK
jgi:hypothetical protein